MAVSAGNWYSFDLLPFSDPAWVGPSLFGLTAYLQEKMIAVAQSLANSSTIGYVDSAIGGNATVFLGDGSSASIPTTVITNDVALTFTTTLDNLSRPYSVATHGTDRYMLKDSVVYKFDAANAALMVTGFS